MSSATPPRIGRMMSVQSNGPAAADGPDVYDALRDLFLGQEESPRPETAGPQTQHPHPHGPRAGRILLETLVLGHLPVQQSPWVMQYAKDAAAQRGGPVALLRVREGEATIDLVGHMSPLSNPPKATIEEALREVMPSLRGVIVRVDPASESLLPSLPCVDAITLLTGADEAAIVGSYRTIKSLVGDSPDHVPPLRLAIMGSTADKALAAADKIQKAVEANLRERLTVTACLARIGAGRSTLIYRGLLTDDIETVLASVKMTLSSPGSTSRPSVSAPEVVPEDVPQEIEPASPVSSRLGHASPASAARPEPAADRTLCKHIPGLVPTAVACPFHKGVEFAIDSQGRLHLLAKADPSANPWQAASGLLAAAQWAQVHASLISMAVGGAATKATGATPPAMHLMTPAVKECRGIPEAGIRVHLLTQVEVEGRRGWFCTEVG